MVYSYEEMRPEFFTDSGNEKLEQVRSNVANILRSKESFLAQDAIRKVLGDLWLALACLDRMVELGELEEVITPEGTWGQHRSFMRPSWHKNPNLEGGTDFFLRKLLFTGSKENRKDFREMMEVAQNRD